MGGFDSVTLDVPCGVTFAWQQVARPSVMAARSEGVAYSRAKFAGDEYFHGINSANFISSKTMAYGSSADANNARISQS